MVEGGRVRRYESERDVRSEEGRGEREVWLGIIPILYILHWLFFFVENGNISFKTEVAVACL